MSDEKKVLPRVTIHRFEQDGSQVILVEEHPRELSYPDSQEYLSVAESDSLRAADRKEIERLRSALEKVRALEKIEGIGWIDNRKAAPRSINEKSPQDTARQALAEEKK